MMLKPSKQTTQAFPDSCAMFGSKKKAEHFAMPSLKEREMYQP
jgi:hypothetical protein